jgi:hypothetical protein
MDQREATLNRMEVALSVSQIWRFGDMSDGIWIIQQSKIIADWLSVSPPGRSFHAQTEGGELKFFEKENAIFARPVVISMYRYPA